MQILYENLSEFGKKVNLGKKDQFGYKVTGERYVWSMDDVTHSVVYQINIYIREGGFDICWYDHRIVLRTSWETILNVFGHGPAIGKFIRESYRPRNITKL